MLLTAISSLFDGMPDNGVGFASFHRVGNLRQLRAFHGFLNSSGSGSIEAVIGTVGMRLVHTTSGVSLTLKEIYRIVVINPSTVSHPSAATLPERMLGIA